MKPPAYERDWIGRRIACAIMEECSVRSNYTLLELFLHPIKNLGVKKRKLRQEVWEHVVPVPLLPPGMTVSSEDLVPHILTVQDELEENPQTRSYVVNDWAKYADACFMWRSVFAEKLNDYTILTTAFAGTIEFEEWSADLLESLDYSAYKWYEALAWPNVIAIVLGQKIGEEGTETITSPNGTSIESTLTPDRFFLVMGEKGPLLCESFDEVLSTEQRKEYEQGVRAVVEPQAPRPKRRADGDLWVSPPEPELLSLLSFPLPEYIVHIVTEKVTMAGKQKIVTLRIDCENPSFELPLVVGFLERCGYEPYRDEDLPLMAVKVDVPREKRKKLKVNIRKILALQQRLMQKVHKHIAKKARIKLEKGA